MNEILKNLEELVGKDFDEDDVICCFQDVENEIIVSKSSSCFYNYIAYENSEDAEMYLIKVDKNNEIAEVWES